MEKKLTILQAFKAMTKFLRIYYQKTKSDDIAVLLGGMQLATDGKPWDPAAWSDWIKSVEAVFKEQNI